MDRITPSQIPFKKIFKDREVTVGTFLGGPLAAGYFIAENYKTFENNAKAKMTWFIAIITTIVIFGSTLFTPEDTPNFIIPAIYTGMAGWLVKHFQGQTISDHIDNGGQIHSWGRTIVISLISLLITFIVFMALIFLSEQVINTSITTRSYGPMQHEIAFDNSNISEKEVDQIAEGFTTTTFFDHSVTKFVYAEKIKSDYVLSISVIEGIEADEKALQPFIQLRNDMQSLFPNHKVIFNLVVNDLDNVVKRIE